MIPGDKNNRLTLIEMVEPRFKPGGGKVSMGVFKCECGTFKELDFYAVKTGHTKQCFKCARKSAASKKITHNMANKHPLYRKWQDMKKRCYNPKVERYKSYGGRGIRVCAEWKDNFVSFYSWCLANDYNPNMEIDRKEVDGDYCPENCHFVTKKENGFNKRNTFYVQIEGKKISLAKLLYHNGLSNRREDIWHGLKKGKSIEFYVEKFNLKIAL